MHRPLTRPTNTPRHPLSRTNTSVCVPRPMQGPNPYHGANCPTGIQSTKTGWPSGRSKDPTQSQQHLCPAIPLQGLMFNPTQLCLMVDDEPFEPHCAVRPCVRSTNPTFSPNVNPCASSTSLACNSEPGVDFDPVFPSSPNP